MSELEVRIARLAPLRVASAHGFGASPEEQAADKILAFVASRGLDLAEARWFGFNNPGPSPGSPNYGYDVWLTVGPEVAGEGDVEIKTFGGGLYAVTRFEDLNRIGDVWKQLVTWHEDSPYRRAHHQWLEELLRLPPPDRPEDFVFDLYLPIAE